MTAITAMIIDAYRQLNAKKLFWITLSISFFVVLGYASIGFNERGMSMLFGLTTIENELYTEGSPVARIVYRGIFSTFIVGIWLAWAATILALISTTTIFPDFVAGGAIDLVLSRPIRRVTLFVIKYLTSLLFVLLQVGLFCIAVFLCTGWRLGEWNWMIFAAVPIVTLFYSYLYAVNVLVGVVTRSALTALLLTLLFWFGLFSLSATEGTLNQFRTQMTVQVERHDEAIAGLQRRIEQLEGDDQEQPVRARLEAQIEAERTQRDSVAEPLEKLAPYHDLVRRGTVFLPKTSETIGLLDRWLSEDADINFLDVVSGNVMLDEGGRAVPERHGEARETQTRLIEELEGRSVWTIIGTSLLFELVVLSIACFVFVRRDY